jgi:hypothetical protein
MPLYTVSTQNIGPAGQEGSYRSHGFVGGGSQTPPTAYVLPYLGTYMGCLMLMYSPIQSKDPVTSATFACPECNFDTDDCCCLHHARFSPRPARQGMLLSARIVSHQNVDPPIAFSKHRQSAPCLRLFWFCHQLQLNARINYYNRFLVFKHSTHWLAAARIFLHEIQKMCVRGSLANSYCSCWNRWCHGRIQGGGAPPFRPKVPFL